MELIRKFALGHVKTLMNLNTRLGFSGLQIEQVVDNCETLFLSRGRHGQKLKSGT